MNIFEQVEEWRRTRPWYTKVYCLLMRLWNRLLDATYWKLRNWNWKSPKPRGFDSRHGYADTVELIPGQMFATFMRYYEGEYLTQQYMYTEENLQQKLTDPDSFQESAAHIRSHLVFQRRIEWVANWVVTVYDTWERQTDWSFEKEEVYSKDMQKAMHTIVRYHGWMWT